MGGSVWYVAMYHRDPRFMALLLIWALVSATADDEPSTLRLLEESVALHEAGDTPTALLKTEMALELSERSGDQQGQAEALLLLGVLRARAGSYSQALTAHGRGLEIFEEREDAFGAWVVLLARGEIYRLMQDSEQALAESLQALEKLRSIAGSGIRISLGSFRMFARHQKLPPGFMARIEPYLGMAQPLLLRFAEA